MQIVEDIASLEEIYPAAVPASLTKVVRHLTPLYRQWIEASRFVVLGTIGPEGPDASPRGDDGAVVRIVDDKTFWMPDWRGNNRLDSLRNILRDGRSSHMFMVPGSNSVVRINGRSVLTADADICVRFEQKGRNPATVIVTTVEEAYFQCAKALLRSGLWTRGDESEGLPSAGAFLRERDATFDSETYDATYVERARDRMW